MNRVEATWFKEGTAYNTTTQRPQLTAYILKASVHIKSGHLVQGGCHCNAYIATSGLFSYNHMLTTTAVTYKETLSLVPRLSQHANPASKGKLDGPEKKTRRDWFIQNIVLLYHHAAKGWLKLNMIKPCTTSVWLVHMLQDENDVIDQCIQEANVLLCMNGCFSLRLFGREEESSESSVLAGMEGKTKEKLESMGLALLCLALRTDNLMYSYGMWHVVMLTTPSGTCEPICSFQPLIESQLQSYLRT